MTPRFTVVVAAYNVQDAIRDTLRSLTACLTADFELICVNDGSTDDTPARIDAALASANCPARRVDIPHSGVSCARNEGLRQAKGEYIAFVDGDDRVTPDYAKSLLAYTETRKPDAVFFGHEGAAGRSAAGQAALGISGADAIERCYRGHAYDLRHTAAAYNRAFLTRHGIRHTPGCRRSQDVEFMLRALLCADMVDIYPQKLYIYVRRAGSVTNVYGAHWFDGVDAMLRAADFASERGAAGRTQETLAMLTVYAFLMLRARALRLGKASLAQIEADARRDYPAQAARVYACARKRLPPLNASNLALCAYRVWPAAFFAMLHVMRREVAA